MRPSPLVTRFPVEEGLLLLDDRSSRLFAFNDTARHVWDLMEAGRADEDLVSEFAEAWGISTALARGDIAAILAQWWNEGLLAADDARAARLAPTIETASDCDAAWKPVAGRAEWTCTIGSTVAAFAVEGVPLPSLRGMLGHLETPDAAAQVHIEITGSPSGEAVLAVDGRERSRTRGLGLLVGGVWQTILELAHPDLRWLALMHGAAIARDGKGIALCGPSGSGKSTLAAGLISAGYDYLTDDMVAVAAPDGMITPLPMPISIKEGSFEVIAARRPELARASRYRTRGVDARLLVPATDFQAPQVRLHCLVFPRFVSGAAPELQEISTFQALERLLADRVWIGYPITVERVEAFVALLNTTPAYSATYGSLDDAMRLVEDAIEGVA